MTHTTPSIGEQPAGLKKFKPLIGRTAKFLHIYADQEVVFPPHCMFTNDSIDELTTMSLVFHDAKGAGSVKVPILKQHEYSLPISPAWLERRTRNRRRFVWSLRIGGPVLILAAVVTFLFCPTDLDQRIGFPGLPVRDLLVFTFSFVGGVGLLWGLAAKWMKGFVDPRSLKAGFSADKNTLVFLDGIHPEFLKLIPLGE